MMENMDRNKLIRILCVALVATVLSLSLILLVAVCGGTAEGIPEETTRRGFHPSLPDEPLDPGDLSDIVGSGDWGDLTREPGSGIQTGDGTLPPEPEVSLPEWDGDFEWPTLPPSLETDPDFEWPTLPEEWDTLPEEWDTFPEEWGDIPADLEDLADLLAGADGSLGLPPGALAAGVAAQLTVMEIYAERNDRVYLMMQAFGDYTGQGWSEAENYQGNIYEPAGPAGIYCYPHYYMDTLTPFSGYPLTVTPKTNISVRPYYLTSYGNDWLDLTGDVKAAGDGTRPYTVYYRPLSTYASESQANPHLRRRELEYRAYVMERYRALDADTAAYMKLIIEQEGFDKEDPDVIGKVAAYIQNSATYNLAYDRNLDREPNVALAFLGAYKEGVCSHYATAATLLFRALGFPARYTVGFMTDVSAYDITAVKGLDAHAWVEVYVEGFGWQYVEVTGGTGGNGPGGNGPGGNPGTDTDTDTDTGGDIGDITGGDTRPPVEPEKDPSTYGDLMAGTKGSLATPTGIPPAVYMSTVFHVTADSADRLLLKLKSFGDYTGQGFGTGVPCSGLLFETYSAAYLPGLYLQYGNAKTHTVRIQSPMGTYGVPYFVVTQGTTEGLTVGDLRVTGDRLSSYQVGYCRTELTYRPVAQPNAVETDIRAAAYEYYLTLDGETAAYLQTLIAEMGWDGSDPAVIPAVADYLRSHCPLAVANEYDTSLDGADNVVLAFLQSPTEVTSRHLAAAATLIYRALGIPARYTVGYLVEAPAGETVTVTGNHAYAWAEVYVNGFGWSPVDVALRDSGENDTFEVTLKPENMAVRYNGETVEHSGVLTGFEAYEKKGYYYEAKISGKRRGCGHTYVTIDSVTIFNKSGADVTHLFDITLEAGDLFVYLEELWFSSVGASKVYDGTPLTAAEAALVSGILPEGYFAEIIPAQGQTVVGTGIAAFEVKIWYDSGNGKPVDRTSNYFLIHKAYGTLTVTPAALTVKAADAQKVYDGEALTAPSIEIVGGVLAEGDYVDSYTVEGSRTEVGRSENNITALIIRNKDGADVTRSYAIDLQAGILRVTED